MVPEVGPLDCVEVITRVIVDPPATVVACDMMVGLGVNGADVDGGGVEDDDETKDGVDEVNTDEELDDGVELLAGVVDEELKEIMEEEEEDDVKVKESEVETGVGLLLAIELDGT